jgi:hypothetical protein
VTIQPQSNSAGVAGVSSISALAGATVHIMTAHRETELVVIDELTRLIRTEPGTRSAKRRSPRKMHAVARSNSPWRSPASPGTMSAMAIPHKLVTELLELPDEERGALVALLLRSFEPDDGDELTGEQWEEIWAAEIDRRTREVMEGRVELIDGEQVAAEIRAMLDAPVP